MKKKEVKKKEVKKKDKKKKVINNYVARSPIMGKGGVHNKEKPSSKRKCNYNNEY